MWIRRCVACLMALILTMTGVLSVVAQGSQPPMVKGAITSIVTRAWSTLGYEYLERAVLRGMGEVANLTEDSAFGKLVSTTKKLLGNPTATAVAEVKELCEEILAELEVIEAEVAQCNEKLDELLTKFAYEDYEEAHKAIVSFKNTYTQVYATYDTLIAALSAYAEEPTSARLTEVKTAYAAVEAFYTDNTGAISDEHLEMEFNFTTDLGAFLEVISPYAYGQTIPTNAQPSDSAYWGTKTTDPTYMDLVYTYMMKSYPYEHEIYEGMMYAMNEAAATATLYLNTHRLFVEVGAQMINTDASLDEETRQTELNALWDVYERNTYRLMRGIEQMVDICHGYTETLMRPYDINAALTMDYTTDYMGQLRFWQLIDTDGESVVGYHLSADKTKETMAFYLVKPVGSTSAYAILKNGEANGWSSDLNNTDLVDVVFESLGATYTGVSADFMNLCDTSTPAGYAMISEAEELAELINVVGYTEQLYSFLATHLYTEVTAEDGTVSGIMQLPSAPAESSSFDDGALGDGMMVPLYDDLHNWSPSQVTSRDMCVDMVDISQPLSLDDLSRNQVEMDTEDDIADSGQNHNNPLVILRNTTPQSIMGLTVSGGGQARLVDDSGANAAGKSLAAGTPLTLYVTPDSGKAVTAVDLCLSDGTVVSLVGGGDGVSVEEALLHAQTDENGAYTFAFPSCYQNATVRVTFADPDPALITYTARIQESTQGDTQFVGNSGIIEQTYRAEQDVTLHIRPYTGYIVDTVTVTDADGNVIATTDVTAEELMYTPTYRVFEFVMPAAAVTVDVTYKDGYTVDLTTQNAGDSAYANYRYDSSSLYDDSWLQGTLTLEEGASITVEATCPSDMYVNEFLITNITTSGAVLGEVNGNAVTFTMPASDVGVKVIFEEVTVGRYYAALTASGSGAARFYTQYPLNTIKHHYEAGDTVTVMTTTDKAFDPIVTVVDTAGNTVEVTALGDGQHQFVMPAANVTVHAQFAEWVEVRMIVDQYSNGVLSFRNPTDSATLTHAWSGDTVYFYETLIPWDEPAAKILSITADDADGNTIDVVKEGDGNYSVKAGVSTIKIYVDCDREQFLMIDESITDVFAVTEDDSGFPGDTVYFKQINSDVTVSNLKVLDNAGREMTWKLTDLGLYEVVLGHADATVYATVDNRQLVTYSFHNSDKYSYSLQGLLLDSGDGTGYALPGTEMCLVISNNSAYTVSKYSETHWVKDADGNELDLRYMSGGTTYYYYFTMPDGPIEVYGYSSYHGGFYSPKPIGERFSMGSHWYRVTNTDDPAVVFVYTEDTAAHLTLPDTVTYDGVEYRIIGVDTTELKDLVHLHSVTVNGKTVTIRAATTTTTVAAPTATPDSPKTGGGSSAVYMLLAVSMTALGVTAVCRRRKANR